MWVGLALADWTALATLTTFHGQVTRNLTVSRAPAAAAVQEADRQEGVHEQKAIRSEKRNRASPQGESVQPKG